MIVVTAPTGQIGTHLTRELIEAGKPVRVIARDASKLHDAIQGRVEVIEGSHGDAAVLDRALAGADAFFWLVPPDATKTVDEVFHDFPRPAVEAIERHGVSRVVGVTSLGRGTRWEDTAGLVTASLRMDDLLMSSGAAFRGLANPSFMENVGRQAAVMKGKGMFFGPIDPDTKLNWVATRDIGAAAARWLADDGWTGQEDVPVIGPEALSNNDIAAIVSELAGREVRYVQISFDQFKQGFLDRGASESFAQAYVDMYRAKAEGVDNVVQQDGDSAQRIGFRQWAEHSLKSALAG